MSLELNIESKYADVEVALKDVPEWRDTPELDRVTAYEDFM